ncbi:MAG: glycoside hydrolase family 88 protein [Clostridia bacterium]|nr:glycoside hydrolase family 88 protein [Clostridia bacterium]
MKKSLSLLLAGILLYSAVGLSSCSDNSSSANTTADHSAATTTGDPAANDPAGLHPLAEYKIVRADSASRDSLDRTSSLQLRDYIRDIVGIELERTTDSQDYTVEDSVYINAKEILIGSTRRPQSAAALEGLGDNEYVIKKDGPKLVICGTTERATNQAVGYFAANYLNADFSIDALPDDFYYKGTVDFNISAQNGMTYTEMGDVIFDGYVDKFILHSGQINGTEFWDTAEILEAVLDAYEQTENKTYLSYAEKIASLHFNGANVNVNWCANNAFNDDIAWVCIGFTRLYNFTGNEKYLTIAKNNFDIMWARAYSPDVLDGGLWWKDDQKNTKNSCIQCPASIAACLIGKATGDDSYYEKAKEVMEWEFEVLFEEDTGKVYDCKMTDGNYNYWASTYNQGTFVGACTLLHEKYGDQKYMDYAAKAVEYGMTKLDNKNGVLNGEASGADLIGFKGILTRWFYRYAEYANDREVLTWLQLNADTAFANRNKEDIVWTAWADKTKDQYYDPWGCSAAIALMFNCEPWW